MNMKRREERRSVIARSARCQLILLLEGGWKRVGERGNVEMGIEDGLREGFRLEKRGRLYCLTGLLSDKTPKPKPESGPLRIKIQCGGGKFISSPTS